MTPRDLIERLTDEIAEHQANADVPLTAKQLIQINLKFSRATVEAIYEAPCEHDSEHNYETNFGRYCGICQRKIEEAA